MGQNKLLFMNGYEINLRSFEEDLTTKSIRYTFTKDRLFKAEPKIIEDEIDMSRLFSLTLKDGSEKLYYKQDSAIGNVFALERARLFVYGARDAQNNYKAGSAFVSGVLFGFTGGLMSQALLTPMVGLTGVAIPVSRDVRISEADVSAESLGLDRCVIINADYRDGFQKVARGKRLGKSIFGAGVGIIGGLIAHAILTNNDIFFTFEARLGKI